MELRVNVPLDAEAVAFEIALHDDETVCAFIRTILDSAARLELDEMLVAQIWRGVMMEYMSDGSRPGTPTIDSILKAYPSGD